MVGDVESEARQLLDADDALSQGVTVDAERSGRRLPGAVVVEEGLEGAQQLALVLVMVEQGAQAGLRQRPDALAHHLVVQDGFEGQLLEPGHRSPLKTGSPHCAPGLDQCLRHKTGLTGVAHPNRSARLTRLGQGVPDLREPDRGIAIRNQGDQARRCLHQGVRQPRCRQQRLHHRLDGRWARSLDSQEPHRLVGGETEVAQLTDQRRVGWRLLQEQPENRGAHQEAGFLQLPRAVQLQGGQGNRMVHQQPVVRARLFEGDSEPPAVGAATRDRVHLDPARLGLEPVCGPVGSGEAVLLQLGAHAAAQRLSARGGGNATPVFVEQDHGGSQLGCEACHEAGGPLAQRATGERLLEGDDPLQRLLLLLGETFGDALRDGDERSGQRHFDQGKPNLGAPGHDAARDSGEPDAHAEGQRRDAHGRQAVDVCRLLADGPGEPDARGEHELTPREPRARVFELDGVGPLDLHALPRARDKAETQVGLGEHPGEGDWHTWRPFGHRRYGALRAGRDADLSIPPEWLWFLAWPQCAAPPGSEIPERTWPMTSVEHTVVHHDDEDAHLASLGYTSDYKRDMSLWGNFSLGFTYLSPVVGVYSLFAFALAAGGPPMIWAVVLAAVGQLLVALVFGEVVSQYPVSGGIYPWARRLWGRRWAWMAGWVYMVALVVTIASVSYGAGPFVAMVLGIEPSTNVTILCALALIAVVTLLNFGGTRLLGKIAFFGFAAELAGALVVGAWLLLTERHHDLGVLFDTHSVVGSGSYLPAFLTAALIGVYLYYGFEACGDVAEEVKNPRVQIPKSMRMTIYVGGFASFLITLALLLAVPDFGAVISGKDADPVTTVLQDAFGAVGFRVVLAVVLISFFSCALSLQAAASRLIYSYARDHMMPASHLLSRFSVTRAVPPYALLLAAAVPAVIVIGSKVSADALTKIVSFASLGIYLGFMMVVLAALRARLKGWVPSGKFRLGVWGLPVTIAAFVYQVLAAVNMAWPRTPDVPWYDNYIVVLSALVVVGVGLVYMLAAKPYLRKDAPHGDAVRSTVDA